MKVVFEELRVEKDKVSKLREANRILDKTSRMQQERMIRLEENVRELRLIKKKNDFEYNSD